MYIDIPDRFNDAACFGQEFFSCNRFRNFILCFTRLIFIKKKKWKIIKILLFANLIHIILVYFVATIEMIKNLLSCFVLFSIENNRHSLLKERPKAEKRIIKAILKLKKKKTNEQTNRQTNESEYYVEMQQGTAFDYLSKDIIENETFVLLSFASITCSSSYTLIMHAFLSINFCLKTTFERHTDGYCIVCCSSIVSLYKTNTKYLMTKCNSHRYHERTFYLYLIHSFSLSLFLLHKFLFLNFFELFLYLYIHLLVSAIRIFFEISNLIASLSNFWLYSCILYYTYLCVCLFKI